MEASNCGGGLRMPRGWGRGNSVRFSVREEGKMKVLRDMAEGHVEFSRRYLDRVQIYIKYVRRDMLSVALFSY